MDPRALTTAPTGSHMTTASPPVQNGVSPVAQVVEAASSSMKKVLIQEHTVELHQAVEAAARDIQKFISSMERNVRIAKDETSGYYIVQLVDPQSGQVVRSLPPDELLRIARSFEILGSKMVHQKV